MQRVKLTRSKKLGKHDVPGAYEVVDKDCLGSKCFAPGEYQVRGAAISGSRNTGAVLRRCLTNCYRGCPIDREFSKELLAARKKEGWKNL